MLMDVNFQNVNNIVHYSPPKDLDILMQQMGRAGRDGTQSIELVIYKANQLKKADDDVIKLLKSTVSCKQKIIMKLIFRNMQELVIISVVTFVN